MPRFWGEFAFLTTTVRVLAPGDPVRGHSQKTISPRLWYGRRSEGGFVFKFGNLSSPDVLTKEMIMNERFVPYVRVCVPA